MVGAELHAATGSAIATRHKASEAHQRRPPPRGHLPFPTAVNVTLPNLTQSTFRPTRLDFHFGILAGTRSHQDAMLG